MKLIVLVISIIMITSCTRNNKFKESKTKVLLWAHEGQPYEKKALSKIIDDFNRSQKEIEAIVEFKQEQGYGSRVNAAALAGKLPDIIEVDGPYTAQFAATNILEPINEFFEKNFLNDFHDSIIKQGTYESKLYTLGSFESTVVVFFNKEITKACNIFPPTEIEDAWTWDKFIAALRKVKKCKPDIMPLETFIVWGGEWMTYAFTPLIWSNGGGILSENKKGAEGFFNSSQSVEAMEEWQKLFLESLSDPNKPDGQFERGKAAFSWGVFNRFPIYKDINFGMMPLPFFKKKVSPSGSWCWGISKKSEKKKEASRVLEWILGVKTGIIPIVESNGGIPSRKTATEKMPHYVETRNLFIEQTEKTAHPRPVIPKYGMLSNIVSRSFLDISKGENVKKTLDRASEEIEKKLK
jgi:fructooligosaccharide transport system substrate-binding protein